MAIIQISRIQHRRGLRIDLPDPLNEAEFGWTTDSRELFIGNGPLHPGNTQVLTEHTPAAIPLYSYRDPYAYELLDLTSNFLDSDPIIATTGYLNSSNGGALSDELIPITAFKTVRSYQEKFDEITSVKDYKAVGDNMNDDTGSIWRACTDLYSESYGDYDELNNEDSTNGLATRRRRVLYFPEGIYRTRQFVPLFPFSSWRGAGKGKTVIFFDFVNLALGDDDTEQAVIQTVDSLGQYGDEMGQDIGNGVALTPYATDIIVEGITFRSNLPQSESVIKRQIAKLARGRRIKFIDCSFEFVGTDVWGTGDSAVNGTISVFITKAGDVDDHSMFDMSFIDCDTYGAAFGFNVVDSVKNVYIKGHSFDNHYEPAKVGYDATLDTHSSRQPLIASETPTHIKVVSSIFRNFDNTGINVYSSASSMPSSIISMYNYFEIPANSVPAIRFTVNTSLCVSAFDTFEQTAAFVCGNAVSTNLRVANYSTSNTVMNAQDLFEIPVGVKNLYVCGILTIEGSLAIIPLTSTTLNIATVPYPSTSDPLSGNVVRMEYGMRIDGSPDTLRNGIFSVIYEENPVGVVNSIEFSDDYIEVNGPPSDTVIIQAIADDPNSQIIIQMVTSASPVPEVSYRLTAFSV